MTHDSTFRLNGTVRLLHEGVHSERPPHDRLADPFPADHAAGSALWNGLPEAAFTMPGRNWVSPEGNVYAALRLPQRHPFTGTAAAPAVGGLIAEALAHMGFDVHMKWPNDLLRREEQEEGPGWCKVGGILL